MNYLELVNRAIFESGADLDELTSVNFASPPRTIMYSRFKNWINDAYREILQKRLEWYTLQERTVLTLYPRVGVRSVSPAILAGDELQGRDSGVRFIVSAVYSDAADPDLDVVLEGTYVLPLDGHLIEGEGLDRIAPAPATNIAVVERAIGYDLSTYIPSLKEADIDTFLVTELPNSTFDDALPGTPQPVFNVVWDAWYARAFPEFSQLGKPMYITEAPDGLLEFWPRLDQPYNFIFNYSKTIPTLSAYNDQPRYIPTDYQMAIVWKAVMKYARFDNKDKLFLNARDEFRFYNNKLEEDKLPQVRMGPNLFWVDGNHYYD